MTSKLGVFFYLFNSDYGICGFVPSFVNCGKLKKREKDNVQWNRRLSFVSIQTCFLNNHPQGCCWAAESDVKTNFAGGFSAYLTLSEEIQLLIAFCSGFHIKRHGNSGSFLYTTHFLLKVRNDCFRVKKKLVFWPTPPSGGTFNNVVLFCS